MTTPMQATRFTDPVPAPRLERAAGEPVVGPRIPADCIARLLKPPGPLPQKLAGGQILEQRTR